MGNLNDNCTDNSNVKGNSFNINSYNDIMKTFKQTMFLQNSNKLLESERKEIYQEMRKIDMSVLDFVKNNFSVDSFKKIYQNEFKKQL